MFINILSKSLIVILLALAVFAPSILKSKAASYNYDFWKNIIPSAEGIAHQDTYYADAFKYHKNDDHQEVSAKLAQLLDTFGLDDIKQLVSKEDYKTITSDDYNNANALVNQHYELSSSVKAQIKILIAQKQELESDTNLYKKIEQD